MSLLKFVGVLYLVVRVIFQPNTTCVTAELVNRTYADSREREGDVLAILHTINSRQVEPNRIEYMNQSIDHINKNTNEIVITNQKINFQITDFAKSINQIVSQTSIQVEFLVEMKKQELRAKMNETEVRWTEMMTRINEMEVKLEYIPTEANDTNLKLTEMLHRLDGMEDKLEVIPSKMNQTELRWARLMRRLDDMEGNIKTLATKTNGTETGLIGINGRINGIEGKIEEIATTMYETNTTLTKILGRLDNMEAKLQEIATRTYMTELRWTRLMGKFERRLDEIPSMANETNSRLRNIERTLEEIPVATLVAHLMSVASNERMVVTEKIYNNTEELLLQVSAAPARVMPGPLSGRLEVYARGEWGTVCDDGFDAKDARVACRQLGRSGNRFRRVVVDEQGAGRIWLDDMACSGREANLLHCIHRRLGVHNCGHDEDVWLNCS